MEVVDHWYKCECIVKRFIEGLSLIIKKCKINWLTKVCQYNLALVSCTKNEYYKNIVNLGKDAVPVLEDMYNKGKLTGVNAYLSALVIQDITKCNLNEKYNLDWSTAEEFYDLW